MGGILVAHKHKEDVLSNVKITKAMRELHEGEISEIAADCIYWWNRGVEGQIYDFLMTYARQSFESGIFDILGDDPLYSEQGIRNRIDEISQSWSYVLCNPLDRSASFVGRRLAELARTYEGVDERLFWRSHLGQLIFYRDGFPMRMLTYGEAAAVLHTTSGMIGILANNGSIDAVRLPIRTVLDRSAIIREWERRTGLTVGNAKMLRVK